jgi:glycosyltransferase involved in cell wall biosynthesis
MDSFTASVIIPTRNRPHVVANGLDALASQTMPCGSFEVIAVDNGSSAPTRRAPNGFVHPCGPKLIR